jgi:nicotinamidase/pyrazinamidase
MVRRVKHEQEELAEREAQIAELVAAVLAGRPERLVDALLATETPEARAGFRMVKETLAAIGLSLPPAAPNSNLRGRILASVQARRASSTRKAFVVLDMIKEHLTPGNPLEVPRARAIVPALRARLAEARSEGLPVVYLVDEHDPDDNDTDVVDGWGAHAMRGGEGTEVWPQIAPVAGDRIVKKATYSAFTGSELGQVLDALRVDTIVLTGCLTEIGILATATEALQRGFAVEVPEDAQAGANEASERVVLGLLGVMPPYGPARRARLEAARGGSSGAQP